jgi:hypothetical protein
MKRTGGVFAELSERTAGEPKRPEVPIKIQNSGFSGHHRFGYHVDDYRKLQERLHEEGKRYSSMAWRVSAKFGRKRNYDFNTPFPYNSPDPVFYGLNHFPDPLLDMVIERENSFPISKTMIVTTPVRQEDDLMFTKRLFNNEHNSSAFQPLKHFGVLSELDHSDPNTLPRRNQPIRAYGEAEVSDSLAAYLTSMTDEQRAQWDKQLNNIGLDGKFREAEDSVARGLYGGYKLTDPFSAHNLAVPEEATETQDPVPKKPKRPPSKLLQDMMKHAGITKEETPTNWMGFKI